jgi:ribosomal protein S18 acetylase RimI-like enzyme
MGLPEGYVFRAPRIDEAAAVADVMNAAEHAVTGEDQTDAESVMRYWTRPDWDLAQDARVVCDARGAIVGYADYDAFDPWTQLEIDGHVHPAHRGAGVGTALLSWGISRGRADSAKAPPGERVVLRAFQWADDDSGRAFFATKGWEICRWFYWMLIDLNSPVPAPSWPEGMSVRSMRPDEERAVWEADMESFRDHWGFVTEPFEDYVHRIFRHEDFRHDLGFIALDGAEIAGLSLCRSRRPEDEAKGWVQDLGVRRPWRRRGIALALLQHSFAALRERGCECVGLAVDAESQTGAVALYEKAGMHVEREAVSYEKVLRPPAI